MPATHGPLPHSYWVRPGTFAAGEYPGAVADDEAAAKLGALLAAGVTHAVDLTGLSMNGQPDGLVPYADMARDLATLRGQPFTWERRSIVDYGVPETPAAMARILDAIDAALAGGQCVYVHCHGGVGRTGTVVGCWLVRHGLSGDDALARLAELFTASALGDKHPKGSPESRQQHDYVRRWAEPPETP